MRNYILLSILLCFSMSVLSAPSRVVRLSPSGIVMTKDPQSGKTINVAYIGAPIKLNFSVETGGEGTPEIVEASLGSGFQITGRQRGSSSSSNIKIVNGKMERDSVMKFTYIYTVVPSGVGDLSIGPLEVKIGDDVLKSNAIDIYVKERTEEDVQRDRQAEREKSKKSEEAFCEAELRVSEKDVFVGQPFVASLLVYQSGDDVAEQQVSLPQLESFKIRELGHDARRELIDGEEFRVTEKRFLMTPLRPGISMISPFTVFYLVPSKDRRRDLFNDFMTMSSFFGRGGYTRKKAVSNSVKLDVQDLDTKGIRADGIGQFRSFRMHTDRTKAMVNEPIKLMLELEGSGNFDHIPAPKLEMPQEFKSYESRVDVDEPAEFEYKGGTKRFEYVVQCPKPGQWKIPRQRFFYFDTKTQEPKEIFTEEIELDIEGDLVQEPSTSMMMDMTMGTTSGASMAHLDSNQPSGIHFIEEDSTGSSPMQRIPWYLFLLVLLIPLFAGGFMWLFRLVFTPGKRRRAYEQALDLLKKAEPNFYTIFVGYFAARYGVHASRVTEGFVAEAMTSSGVKPDKVTEFTKFIGDCATASFGASRGGSVVEMTKKSRTWLTFLNRKLRDAKS
ncbi:hypothetical protein HOD08_00625 [bacterium]|nr:hypothetical protein [bacterium]